MKERVYRILNIKNSESSQVFDLLTVQFFIGLANALVNIIALTLFVHDLSIHSLPLVYLLIAGLLIFFNVLYEKLEHAISPVQLVKYVIGFCALLLVGLWIGLNYGNKDEFVFILLACSVLIYMVNGYAFWGLVSLLFNVRESRRVFSIVGSGDLPAKLIGYLLPPLFIPFLGLSNLIWLAVISLLAGLFLFSHFTNKKSWEPIRNKPHEIHHHEEHHHVKTGLIAFFFKHKLIFTISLLSIISYNVFVLIDYTFISQVKLRYENITDLAFYISIFFAIGRLIAMAFKLIFTSRVIERLGVIYCLFITPGILFLFCLVFFLTTGSSNTNLFIFGVMAMITEVLRSTMQEPVFLILFQPLKENLRLKGHIISKGYMYPPSLIIVGLSLWFLHRTGVELTILLAVKVVLLNLFGWAVIIFFMRRTYLDTVHASIKKGIFNSEEIYITDQQTIDILLNKITRGKRIEVIYALNILEQAGYDRLDSLLYDQLSDEKDIEVKKFALDRLDSKGKIDADTLRSMLNAVTDIELEQKIVSLLCKYDSRFLEKVSENISANDNGTRKIIIINLLNHTEFNYLIAAGKEIDRLITSHHPAERELAVEIISELKTVQFTHAIEKLINDREIAVQRVAVTAVCKLRMQRLLPSIMAMLDKPEHKNIVLKGLQLYGDRVFEDLRKLEVTIPVEHIRDLVKIAGRIKGECSTAFLLDKLNVNNENLQYSVLHSLWLKGYEPVDANINQRFSDLLEEILKTGRDKITDYGHIPAFEFGDLISRSIYNEVKGDLQMSLKLCSMLYGAREVNRVLELMEVDKKDKLYNAMEMLELMLPKKVSKEVNVLFDFILDPVHSSHASAKQDIKNFYHKVMFNEPHLYNSWTKAVCVYSSWKSRDVDFLDKLKGHQHQNDHYLVQETKLYVMDTINNIVC
ncbi:MAG: MFS transporter [Bacteroidetes bacterium]|nr:MFS transporter [Bacteroidota bacterium]